MPKTQSTDEFFPGEAEVISKAVAESLDRLNETSNGQAVAIARLAELMMAGTIELVKDANKIAQKQGSEAKTKAAKEVLSKAVREAAKAKAAALATSAPIPSPSAGKQPETALQAAAAQALANAYHNAVSAQQQAGVTAQATLTMGVATMFSVVTAALGKIESEKIQAMHLALQNTLSAPQ